MNEAKGIGYLKVQAVAADGAFPVEGAVVMVMDGADGESIATLRTDSSGFAETLTLPAPSRELSQSPGNGVPYSVYTVLVAKEGYNTVSDISVPVFDGVVALQRANLIPLSLFSPPKPGEVTVETPGYPQLTVIGGEEP